MRRTITIIAGIGFILLAGLIAVYGGAGSPAQQNSDEHHHGSSSVSWQVYENDRFGYRLEVPKDFQAQEGPTNADGLTFTYPSGSSSVRVFARNNTNNQSFDAILSEQTQDLQSLRDADIGSSTASLFGRTDQQAVAKKILYRPTKIAVVSVNGNRNNDLATSTRGHILASFQWTDSLQAATTPATSTSDQLDSRPVSYTPDAAEDLITVATPTPEQVISSPLEITGQARGQWLFEADAPVVLTDWDGRIIAEGAVTAESSWMTEEFVPFSGTLEFSSPENTGPQSVRGSLIIQRANPSGQPENDMAVEIPVRFQQ